MAPKDAGKQLVELEAIIGEILGKLSARAKPGRTISLEELKMGNSCITLAKKIRQLLEKTQ